MKNKLVDLNNHLFARLECLCDDDLKGDALKEEIYRSKVVADLSKQIIDNAKLALEVQKALVSGFIEETPEMLKIGR